MVRAVCYLYREDLASAQDQGLPSAPQYFLKLRAAQVVAYVSTEARAGHACRRQRHLQSPMQACMRSGTACPCMQAPAGTSHGAACWLMGCREWVGG